MDKNYFRVPNDIFNTTLNINEKLVFVYLCRCQNNRDYCWPSYETIAKKCGISRRTSITVINSLIKKGLLKKLVRPKVYKKHYTNMYQIVLENIVAFCNPTGEKQIADGEFIAPKKEPNITITNTINNYDNGNIIANIVSILGLSQDVIVVVEYYFKKYKLRFNRPHPNLKSNQMEYVARQINSFFTKYCGISFMPEVIDKHFDRTLDTDYNIMHFCNNSVFEYSCLEANRA